jgi:hypothetical protein
MVTYQHKESGVVYGFIGYTSDGFVGLQAGNDKHCLPTKDFKAWYRKFNPKCGDLLESENFVVKFYHFLGDNYESFLGQIMQCKSGGKIEGVDTFTTEFFRTMSKDKADKITEKLDKLNNLDQKTEHQKLTDLASRIELWELDKNGDVKNKHVILDKEKEEQKKEQEQYDFVNPEHYKQGSMEVIDMMKLLWGTEALILHCEMTAFKYRMRAGRKPDQSIERDLEKARWYDDKAKKLRNELS